MLAFESPWHILALLGAIVLLRAGVPRLRFLHRRRGAVLEFVDSGLVAVLLVFFILRPFVVQAFYIPSGSMEPTLLIGDRILVNKFIYYFRAPRVGDIAVFKPPPQAHQEKKDFIKRVVGGAGDRIEVRNGYLYRYGQPMDEPYIKGPMRYEWPAGPEPYVVPEGAFFVMGDNRNNSNDSHHWGPLPRSNITGKAFCIFWPPHRIRLVR